MSNYLLDTNAAIARINGDSSIIPVLETAQSIAIPIMVVGELLYGAQKSGRVEDNIRQVEEFITGRILLMCDLDTARWYGRISNSLRIKGKPIPQNNRQATIHSVWIIRTSEDFPRLTSCYVL